ncbi:MAG TPA: glycosyltransferase, partial [Myxococcota bacterium]|nr:glycosyltransferase [Myxococcota bacterium]
LTGARATAFIDDMAAAYREADLLLCRAGASTLAEVTVCGRPAILVPFPFAADDHQSANARTLAQSGGALHIPQDTLTADGLLTLLQELTQDPARLRKMAACSRAEGKPDAVRAIADTLEQEVARV